MKNIYPQFFCDSAFYLLEQITKQIGDVHKVTHQTCIENSIIADFHNGDRSAYNRLLYIYKPIIESKSKMYFGNGLERQDIVQEGMIGLYMALKNYCPDRGSSFKSYAIQCINSYMINALRTATRKKQHVLNSSVSLHVTCDLDTEMPELIHCIPDEHALNPESVWLEYEEDEWRKQQLRRLYAGLTKMEKDVFYEMLQGSSYSEIITNYEYSYKSIDNAYQRIRQKIGRFRKCMLAV